MLLNSFRFGGVGTSQRNPHSGFDNAAAYVPNTGITISGGKLVYASVAAFTTIQQNYGFRTPVTPSIPYTIAITADSITAGPKTFRLIAEYWRGQDFADGQSTILASASSADLAFNTGNTLSFVATPPSDCTHIQLVLDVRQGPTSATFDNFTVTG